MKRILIVDDEENIGRSLKLILEREGFGVSICHTLGEARAFSTPFDAYLLDMRLPDGHGIDLLRDLKPSFPSAPVIMISGHGTIADAVEATRAGAYDFLEKPLSRDKVLVTLRNALETSGLKQENAKLKEIAASASVLANAGKMIGDSGAFARVLEQATLAARSDARVLLMGESGTGKELLAAHIHEHSPFAKGAFVKVNCAAIPTELMESELFGHEKGAFTGATSLRRGKFELADGGTIFLDEVGDLHAGSQAKLLRVLQEGEFHRVGGEQPIRVSVRVISATNRDLQEMVAAQKFREDLYYRLCVFPIRVPCLRERPSDIPKLASYFLDDFCRRNGFKARSLSEDAMDALSRYHWPGNIRELRNAVERMAILASATGEDIGVDAVPVEIRLHRPSTANSNLREARDSAERDHILKALEESGWNVSSAARTLGMERTNLHKRIKSLGLRRGPVN
jgi:two-component system, NtrC family, nitrogen regulation response regulator NtrX